MRTNSETQVCFEAGRFPSVGGDGSSGSMGRFSMTVNEQPLGAFHLFQGGPHHVRQELLGDRPGVLNHGPVRILGVGEQKIEKLLEPALPVLLTRRDQPRSHDRVLRTQRRRIGVMIGDLFPRGLIRHECIR